MRTAEVIADYHESLPDRPVSPSLGPDELWDLLGGPLPEGPTPAGQVLELLVYGAEPGLVATAGPRYFGFVIGGSLSAATCADLLATGWDQPAFNAVTAPAAAVIEEVAGGWLKEMLGLPARASFGFVTGGQGANTVALAAARHHVLAQAGWDVERDGLIGAPAVRVIAGAERHATIDRSLRLLGFGTAIVEPVPPAGNGAIDVACLGAIWKAGRPGQRSSASRRATSTPAPATTSPAGCEAARRHGAWVHVDGAFGLWAGASPATRHLVAGVERADSWACDGHKWLNVPYDSGFVFCAHPDAHRAAMSMTAAYLVGHGTGPVRAPSDYVPESSRRARGFAVWAALQQLGRVGVAELVERCCRLARRFAGRSGRRRRRRQSPTTSSSTRSWSTSATTARPTASSRRSSGGTCWMGGTSGTAGGSCASRCPTGPPPKPTRPFPRRRARRRGRHRAMMAKVRIPIACSCRRLPPVPQSYVAALSRPGSNSNHTSLPPAVGRQPQRSARQATTMMPRPDSAR